MSIDSVFIGHRARQEIVESGKVICWGETRILMPLRGLNPLYPLTFLHP